MNLNIAQLQVKLSNFDVKTKSYIKAKIKKAKKTNPPQPHTHDY